ncbi:hypothetical protein quinque_015378 [Culex quinquefasciatus]
MKTATAPAVCTVLENLVFNLFGAPSVCITDNAKVFSIGRIQKCLDRYGVSHWNLAVYHPSPNPSERVNRVIVTAIRCALNRQADHRDWDENVQQIAKAIRTSVHESTGFTPFFINFGRNMAHLKRSWKARAEPITVPSRIQTSLVTRGSLVSPRPAFCCCALVRSLSGLKTHRSTWVFVWERPAPLNRAESCRESSETAWCAPYVVWRRRKGVVVASYVHFARPRGRPSVTWPPS